MTRRSNGRSDNAADHPRVIKLMLIRDRSEYMPVSAGARGRPRSTRCVPLGSGARAAFSIRISLRMALAVHTYSTLLPHRNGEKDESPDNVCFANFGHLIPASLATVAQETSLFPLACQYRVAVENFEDVIQQVRGIDRNDERLVDRLDDATAKDAARGAQPPPSESTLSPVAGCPETSCSSGDDDLRQVHAASRIDPKLASRGVPLLTVCRRVFLSRREPTACRFRPQGPKQLGAA